MVGNVPNSSFTAQFCCLFSLLLFFTKLTTLWKNAFLAIWKKPFMFLNFQFSTLAKLRNLGWFLWKKHLSSTKVGIPDETQLVKVFCSFWDLSCSNFDNHVRFYILTSNVLKVRNFEEIPKKDSLRGALSKRSYELLAYFQQFLRFEVFQTKSRLRDIFARLERLKETAELTWEKSRVYSIDGGKSTDFLSFSSLANVTRKIFYIFLVSIECLHRTALLPLKIQNFAKAASSILKFPPSTAQTRLQRFRKFQKNQWFSWTLPA